MKHEILTGDCLNLMRQMPDNSDDFGFLDDRPDVNAEKKERGRR